MLFGSEKNPKGPNFKKAKWREKNLSGTLLTFKAPDSRGLNSEYLTETPVDIDIYDSSAYFSGKSDDQSEKEIRGQEIYSAVWEFFSIPFVRSVGRLLMGGGVCEITVLPANESLFDPTIFNREMERRIAFNLQNECHEGRSLDPTDFTQYRWPDFLSPINTQMVSRGGSNWYYYETQPLNDDTIDYFWFTPIGPRHYISLPFSIMKSVNNAGNSYRKSQRVPSEPFVALMHNIMNSVTLTLSAEAQKQKDSFAHVIPPAL